MQAVNHPPEETKCVASRESDGRDNERQRVSRIEHAVIFLFDERIHIGNKRPFFRFTIFEEIRPKVLFEKKQPCVIIIITARFDSLPHLVPISNRRKIDARICSEQYPEVISRIDLKHFEFMISLIQLIIDFDNPLKPNSLQIPDALLRKLLVVNCLNIHTHSGVRRICPDFSSEKITKTA